MSALPQVTRIYQNHRLDSTRWQHYRPRSDDIIIATSLKSGMTWMQKIVRQLIFITITDDMLPSILNAVTLEAMREREGRLDEGMRNSWKEGAKTFFFKGTNGRWRDVHSAEEVQMYEEKAAQVLTPECRAWLEQGRVALQQTN